MHAEEEAPIVREIVKNAKHIPRIGRKDAHNSDSSYFANSVSISFHLSPTYCRYSDGQFRYFFGALEISVYIINRNISAGDCNVIIKYSPG